MIVYRHVSAAANTGFCGGGRSGLLSTTKTFSLFMRFQGKRGTLWFTLTSDEAYGTPLLNYVWTK